MAANGISTLATKQLRQVAKLNLAAVNRETVGNPRFEYILAELPANYVNNTSVPNPHPDGLVDGRPWIVPL